MEAGRRADRAGGGHRALRLGGRVPAPVLAFGLIDLALGVLFVVSGPDPLRPPPTLHVSESWGTARGHEYYADVRGGRAGRPYSIRRGQRPHPGQDPGEARPDRRGAGRPADPRLRSIPPLDHLPEEARVARRIGYRDEESWGPNPSDREPLWYDPAEGLATLLAILAHLDEHPRAIRSGAGELRAMERALRSATVAGVRFHVCLDV